jgi:hypothetical protein
MATDSEPLDPPDRLIAQIRALDALQRQSVQQTLGILMETQRMRIEYAESRRGSLATVGGVILAAGLAGLLSVAKSGDWQYFPAWLGLLCLTIGLISTGVSVISLYGRQTNWNYPFKAVSSTWKHFYRDAIDGADSPAVPWHIHQTGAFKATSEGRFRAIRSEYVRRTLSLADDAINLAQDVEQSYLLHWNEMYKNRFLTQLRKALVVGIVASVLLGVTGFVVGGLLAPQRFAAHGLLHVTLE